MKKLVKFLVTLAVIICNSVVIYADTTDLGSIVGDQITLGGIKYYLSSDNGTAYLADGRFVTESIVVIPSEIKKGGKTYIVREINASSFSDNQFITSVITPNTVHKIDNNAFHNCTNLESVKLPNHLDEFGHAIFFNCEKLESIQLSDGIKGIKFFTFSQCSNLKRIVIPQSVEKIHELAFNLCENLEEVIILNPNIIIDDAAFMASPNVKIIFSND